MTPFKRLTIILEKCWADTREYVETRGSAGIKAMPEETKKKFTVEDDKLDNELCRKFKLFTRLENISEGALISRGMYLAMKEITSDEVMEAILDDSRDNPEDPDQPLNENYVMGSKDWSVWRIIDSIQRDAELEDQGPNPNQT